MTDIPDKAVDAAQDAFNEERRIWNVIDRQGWKAERAERYGFVVTDCPSFNAAHKVIDVACWRAALTAAAPFMQEHWSVQYDELCRQLQKPAGTFADGIEAAAKEIEPKYGPNAAAAIRAIKTPEQK